MSAHRGRLLLGALLAVVLLGVFFRGTNWPELGEALRRARPAWLAGLAGVTVLVYLVRAWRWGYLLAPLGRVSFPHLFSATMVGFASGLLVPRAGEIVRPWLVSRRAPIAVSAGFATIILERLLDLGTVLVLLGLYLFILPGAPAGGGVLNPLKVAAAVAGVAALAMLAVLLALHAHGDRAGGLLEHVLRRAPRWLGGPLARALRAFAEGLAVLRAPAWHWLAIVAQSLLLWLLIAVGFHMNHLAFSLALPFRATFLLITFLTVGVAIPTPGMVGGFHAFYLIALADVLGVDRESARAAGTVAHALSSLPVLALGLFFLRREGLSLARVAEVAGEGPVGVSAPSQEVLP